MQVPVAYFHERNNMDKGKQFSKKLREINLFYSITLLIKVRWFHEIFSNGRNIVIFVPTKLLQILEKWTVTFTKCLPKDCESEFS